MLENKYKEFRDKVTLREVEVKDVEELYEDGDEE